MFDKTNPLSPCPMCGGDAAFLVHMQGDTRFVRAMCLSCQVATADMVYDENPARGATLEEAKQRAAGVWNRRQVGVI